MSTVDEPAANGPPRQVILFTGHMVDAPTRTLPRFPAVLVPAAGVAENPAHEAAAR